MREIDTVWHDESHRVDITLDPPALVNSATWTLRDDTGAVVDSRSNVALNNEGNATLVSVLVPQSANQKGGSETVSYRFLEVSWASAGGRTHRTTVAYRIASWVALSATKGDVRGLLGLNDAELPDDDIDLMGSALALRETIGASFPNGTTNSQRLICLHAALSLRNSITLRVASAMASDNVSFKRLADLDIDAIMYRISGDYDATFLAVAPGLAVSFPVPTFMALAGPTTDPITGS